MKKCTKCGELVEAVRFATYRTRDGEIRRRGVCKSCRNSFASSNFEKLQSWRKDYNQKTRDARQVLQQARRQEARAFVDRWKSVPCADCGASWPPVAMDLDHVNGDKVANVSRLVGSAYKLDLILAELLKCEVVCACCHRLRTAAREENVAPHGKDRVR